MNKNLNDENLYIDRNELYQKWKDEQLNQIRDETITLKDISQNINKYINDQKKYLNQIEENTIESSLNINDISQDINEYHIFESKLKFKKYQKLAYIFTAISVVSAIITSIFFKKF